MTWRTSVELAGAFGTAEPVLAPAPSKLRFDAAEPGSPWYLPPGFDIRLYYGSPARSTASYPNGAFDKTAAVFGGLLLDEVTQAIPNLKETAKLAFNYDRPSHEPPQTLLVVCTPATNGEQWNWEDLRARPSPRLSIWRKTRGRAT